MDDLGSLLKMTRTQLPSVVCFTGKVYPLLFLSYFVNKTVQLHSVAFRIIDMSSLDTATLQSLLSMSFLGEHFLMWCSAVVDSEQKKIKEFIRIIQSYKGP